MIGKNKKIVSLGLLLAVVLFWQFGFFGRFNYLTAHIDIWRNSVRIVNTEPPLHACGVPCIGLKEKYGFHEHFISCNQTEQNMRGIKAYNNEIEKYLNKNNGQNWREKYQAEMDSLIKNNKIE